MRTAAIFLLLVTIASATDTIETKRVDTDYFAINIPDSWQVDTVAGKEGEMQLSLRFQYEGKKEMVPIFAYWNGLDPRKWVGTNVTAQYSLKNKEYFLKRSQTDKTLEMIVTGKTFIVTATFLLTYDTDTLTLLLNSMNTLEAK